MTIEELYLSERKNLLKYVYWKLGPYWAEDVVQDLFVELIKYPHMANKGGIGHILYLLIGKYRAAMAGRGFEVEDDDLVEEGDTGMDCKLWKQLIQRYTEHDKGILNAMYIEGMTTNEAADLLHTSREYILKLMCQFRKGVKNEIQDC